MGFWESIAVRVLKAISHHFEQQFTTTFTMQRQTDLALRKNEEQYRPVFDNDSECAFNNFNIENLGKFEDANQVTFDLYGYSKR